MIITFYVGYQKTHFNTNTLNETGLGGTEQCVIHLAKELAQNHKVYVTGEVIPGEFDGVEYITTSQFKSQVPYTDLLIGVSYIHFLKEFEDYSYNRALFWVHNTDYYPWWKGEELENHRDYLNHPKLEKIICLTEWHKNTWLEQFPECEGKIEIIGNGIDIPTLIMYKNPHQFVYTSHAERGLDTLLEEWPTIKQNYPEATLKISTPDYGQEYLENNFLDKINSYSDIEYLGSLPKDKLYELLADSTYWYYPTEYEETFCITALEMLAFKVKPITNEIAGLGETLNGYNAFSTLDDIDLDEAQQYALSQSWSNKSSEWEEMFYNMKPHHLHPDLYDTENWDEWKSKFIHKAALTQEWDLITDEPITDVFTLPLFTEEFCRKIIAEAEYKGGWEDARHDYYPTVDMLLEKIGYSDIYHRVLKEFVYPCAIHKWVLEGSNWKDLHSENFIIRYTKEEQGHLSLHHDNSRISLVLALNEEFEGGGTYFSRQGKLHKGNTGHISIHPGMITHRHGGRPVTDGKRYIIVSFCNIR